MCYINFIRGDLFSPPFENRKFMIGALIGAGASILGAKLNNDAIAKNNQRQEQLIHEQNSYNAPDQQVARMRQAGLNPYMMLGQVNSGNQAAIATTQAGNYDTAANGVGNAVTQALTSKLNNSTIELNQANSENALADAGLKKVDLLSRGAKNLAEINNLVEQGKLTKEQAEQLKQQNELVQLTWDERIKRPGLENQGLLGNNAKLSEETVSLKLQNAITEANGKKLSDAQLSYLSAQIVDMVESAKLKASQKEYYDTTNPMQKALLGSQIQSNLTSSPLNAFTSAIRNSDAFNAVSDLFNGNYGKLYDFLIDLGFGPAKGAFNLFKKAKSKFGK